MGEDKRTEENPAYRVHQCSPRCINARDDGRRQKNRGKSCISCASMFPPVHQRKRRWAEAKEQRKILHIVCINVPPVASTQEMMGGGKRTEKNPAYRVHQCSPRCINARNDGRRQKNRGKSCISCASMFPLLQQRKR
jgi:hypothetical protein